MRLGKALLDLDRGTLSVGGTLVDVRSKTFHLICHLARNPGRVVGKDELMEAVWPTVIVTEDSLTQCIRDARKAIGDDEQTVIRTVPRRGYVLVSAGPAPADAAEPPPPRPAAFATPEPLIAVLPFSGEASQRLMLDAFVEEIGNAIAGFRSVAVIAQASANRFPPEDQDPVRAGRELQADYCLGGQGGPGTPGRLRLHLTEVATGRRLWNDQIVLSEDSQLEGPGEIATRVVGTLIGTVEAAAGRRALGAPTASLQAYGHMVNGIALLRQHGDGVNEAARAYLLKARELDPRSGLVEAYLALAEALIAFHAGADLKALRAARERAAAACALSPDEARCYRIMGIILSFLKEYAAAEAMYAKALELNPYDADTLAQFGYIRAVRGHPGEGLDLMARAARLNPFHPDWYHMDRFAPLYMVGRYGEAAEALERLPHRRSRHAVRLAAAYAMDGQAEKAARRLADALEADPAIDLGAIADRIEWERAEHRRLLAVGIDKARALLAATDLR
jgi:DNA-binding winged helix-turn-helix (wHTH) protein/tetratricopeptide (TPR) repeat protein